MISSPKVRFILSHQRDPPQTICGHLVGRDVVDRRVSSVNAWSDPVENNVIVSRASVRRGVVGESVGPLDVAVELEGSVIGVGVRVGDRAVDSDVGFFRQLPPLCSFFSRFAERHTLFLYGRTGDSRSPHRLPAVRTPSGSKDVPSD